MSNEELCITILITFGILDTALLIAILLIDTKIDKIQKNIKEIKQQGYMNILTDEFLRKRKTDYKK